MRAHNQGLTHVHGGARRLLQAGTPTPAPTEAPANTVLPTITGTPTSGQTLTASPGTWSNSPTSYAYQWKADGTNISGATASTFLLTDTQVGKAITVAVTATNVVGPSTPAVSAATSAVAAGGAGTLDPAITAPVLTLAVGATTYPPEFDVALDDTVAVGDAIQLQWDDDIRLGSITADVSNTIDSGEATANAASFTGLSSIASGTNYFRARVVQADGDYSAWSNTVLHGAAVDSTPAAFSFTDQTSVAHSATIESAAVTLSGFNQPVAISVSGGEYAIDTGAGFGAYTSAAGTAYPGDQVKVRHTSGAGDAIDTDTVLTVGGVSDTFRSTTSSPYTAEATQLFLRMDAVGTDPDTTRKGHIDTLIAALKTAGVWVKLDYMYVLAAHEQTAAELNWISTSFTAVGFGALAFVADRGVTGGSGIRYTTDFDPATGGAQKWTQNSATLGVYIRNDVADATSVDCGNSVPNQSSINSRDASSQIRGKINAASNATFATGLTTGAGHITLTRTSSVLTTCYKNGVSTGTSTAASTAPDSQAFRFCGVPNNLSTRQQAAHYAGAGLTAGEAAALHTALEAYMDAVGAGVV